jgi:peptidoglycan/LPS O-acetylase OafA/YrhL
VFAFHVVLLGEPVGRTSLDRVVQVVGLTGWLGVDLFFVLSGFLITGILLDTRGGEGWLKRFYLRRAFRIVPAYYLALASLAIALFVNGNFQLSWFGWAATWLTNILLARDGWAALPTPLHHYWSLAVEEQFYLLWPFLVAFMGRRALFLLCVGLIIDANMLRVALYHSNQAAAGYVILPARIDGLAIGAILALMVRQDGDLAVTVRRVALPTWIAGLVLLGVIVLHPDFSKDDATVMSLGRTSFMVLAGGLMMRALARGSRSRLGRFFGARPLRFVGKYSYALYLWHQPIIFWLAGLKLTALLIPKLAGSDLPGVFVLAAAGWALSVAAALFSWRLVEAPAARIKERLTAHPAP